MIFKDRIPEIRANSSVLMDKIAQPARIRKKEQWICPFCGHGSHGDGLVFNRRSRDGKALICFNCGFSGDVIDLLKKQNNCTTAEAIQMAKKHLNIMD